MANKQQKPNMDEVQKVSHGDLANEAFKEALTILVKQEGVWTTEALERWEIGRAEMAIGNKKTD